MSQGPKVSGPPAVVSFEAGLADAALNGRDFAGELKRLLPPEIPHKAMTHGRRAACYALLRGEKKRKAKS